MKFELDSDQLKLLDKFQKKIKRKYKQYGLYTYSFTPTGIGDCVEVSSNLCSDTLDLSMVEKW